MELGLGPGLGAEVWLLGCAVCCGGSALCTRAGQVNASWAAELALAPPAVWSQPQERQGRWPVVALRLVLALEESSMSETGQQHTGTAQVGIS